VASEIKILAIFVDWVFKIALMPSTVAILDDKAIPVVIERILGLISSENVIVVIRILPFVR
jgi:hypothetical protein